MSERGAAVVRVACVGDVMLDVLVQTADGLVPDDDVPGRIRLAPGGQAANVAVWVAALGGSATVVGPRCDDGSGVVLRQALAAYGVALHGARTGRPGAVVSVLTAGTRSLVSDPGDVSWLAGIAPGDWLDGLDWLYVSGYALLRAPEPAAVFATEAEWEATHPAGEPLPATGFGAGGRSVLVLKDGARGATFVIDGVADRRGPVAGAVVDVTGAGDALAAGFLAGGTETAMAATARCLAGVGAQPGPAR